MLQNVNNFIVFFSYQKHYLETVPDLERSYANPLVRHLPIPHLHDWGETEACLINFNKVKDVEGFF